MTSFLNSLQSELTSYVRKSLAITMVTKYMYIFSVFSKSLYNCTPTTFAFDEHKNYNTNNSTPIRLSTKPFIKGHGRLALLQ